jgi:hypothetical protein
VKAFVVSVSGRKVCTAGIEPNGVLSTIIHWVGGGPSRPLEGTFGFRVGGLDTQKNEHVDWDTPAVNVGDVICIEIVEADAVDAECERQPSTCGLSTRAKRARRRPSAKRQPSAGQKHMKGSPRKSRPGSSKP